jgi:omega-amidase
MKKNKLIIYGYQGEISWENPETNRQNVLKIIEDIRIKPDLLVFPETFTTGFSNRVDAIAETMDGQTVSLLKEQAAKHDMAIAGSMVIKEKNKYFNRFIFIHPQGHVDFYDKRHLFTMSGEDKAYSRGMERKVVEFRGWRILLQVCYDLRFPVWSRNLNEYDMIIYTANWPQQRQQVWEVLLRARAIENQCYVFGLNRTGTDGNSIGYIGGSVFVDPRGIVMNNSHSHESLVSMQLSLSEMLEFRKKFPVLEDQDRFSLLY